ncbi:IS110 family transposase, partial [Sebaldella sp. S0638]|uniref:IS110 family transposase n=1 Tax=Sebaldella sp. S0638 TaxID=2957809 RepID=UPI00209D2EC4
MFFCGIDIGKFSHVASFIDSDGILIKTFSFKNSIEGFKSFFDISSSIDSDFDNISFAMEATGHYWLNIYAFLMEFAKNIYVINPIQSEALRNLFIKSNKSDIIDSFLIAEVIRINRFTSSAMADDKTMALKELTRFRTFQVQSIACLKTKAIKVLDVIFPEYHKAFSDTFGNASMEILLNFPTPDQLLNISTTKLTKFLKTASKGRLGEDKALFIKDIAFKSVGISVGLDGFIFELQNILNQ